MLNIANYRDMKVETTLRNHPTPVRIAILKKNTETNDGKDVQKREPSYTLGGKVPWAATMENSVVVSQTTRNRTAV